MNEQYSDYFEKYEFYRGRCFGSKTGYLEIYPNHLVVFNSRIYIKDYYEREKDRKIRDFFAGQKEEIWYGDLDLTKDLYYLFRIKLEIGVPLIITYENGEKVIEIGE